MEPVLPLGQDRPDRLGGWLGERLAARFGKLKLRAREMGESAGLEGERPGEGADRPGGFVTPLVHGREAGVVVAALTSCLFLYTFLQICIRYVLIQC